MGVKKEAGVDAEDHESESNKDESKEEESKGAEEEDPDKPKPVIFIAAFVTLLLALGVFEIVFNLEDNKCRMTYMYEYPEYISIEMKETVQQRYPKYGLYAYGEGKMVEDLNEKKYNGIPVVFIPGNSGSYKQVRSMASVALRKAIDDSEYKVHFDYFAVDFAEERSAIYGGVLEPQTEYVRLAIRKILSLYSKSSSKNPTSVVILGHSMGGLIAKSLFLDPDFNPAQVQVLITLSTPSTPVIVLDRQTQDFYEEVNNLWDNSRNTSLQHITLVNIGGGARDLQVRGGLTQDSYGDLNIATTAASTVWVSTDHRCIVWCKQLVLVLNRALFDMISPTSKQITNDRQLRRDIILYHLYRRSGGKEYVKDEMHPSPLLLDGSGYWSDVLKRQFTFSKANSTCNHYALIKISADIHHKFLTLDAIRMDADDWVFGCKETKIVKNTRVCESADNLSGDSVIIPSRGKRKAYQVDLHNLKKDHGYTHLVIHTPMDSEDAKVNVDIYDPRERVKSTTVPRWITFWKSYPVIEKTLPGAVFYNISIGGIEHPWQAYRVHVTPLKCNHVEIDKVHYGIARFYTPWANDTTQILVGEGHNLTNSLPIKLMTSRPHGLDASITPQVHLYLDPVCTYSISIQASVPMMMSQMVRFYAPMMLSFTTCVLVLILAFQLRRFEEDRYCRSTLLILLANVSPISVVLPSRMLAYVAAVPIIVDYLPRTDILTLQERGLDFGVLPIVLMFGCIGIVFVLTSLLWMAVVVCGSIAHKAVLAYLARFTRQEVVAELTLTAVNRFPAILAVFLVALALGSCGALALAVGSFCYFVKIFMMYEEYLEGLVKRCMGLKKEDDPSQLSAVNFQLSLAQLWFMNTLLNLPTLLTFAENFMQGGVPLPADPSLLHALVMSACLPLLWKDDGKPGEDKKYYAVAAVVLQFTAILVGCFGTLSVYRVPFAISSIFVVVSLHQLLAPTEDEEAEEDKAASGEAVETVKETQHITKDQLNAPVPESKSQESSESDPDSKGKQSLRRRKMKKQKLNTKSASKLSDSDLGEEGLDWEQDTESTDDDITVLIYPYYLKVWNRLKILPNQFLQDILHTLIEGVQGLVSLLSFLWTVHNQPPVRIDITPASPEVLDDEYLPYNHPLRKLRKPRESIDTLPVERVSVLAGLTLNTISVIRGVVYFHWKFYNDIFTTLSLAVSFLIYLIYPAPIDFYRTFLRAEEPRESREPGETSSRSLPSLSITKIQLPRIRLNLSTGVGRITSIISDATAYIGLIVSEKLKERREKMEENRKIREKIKIRQEEAKAALFLKVSRSTTNKDDDVTRDLYHRLPTNPDTRYVEEEEERSKEVLQPRRTSLDRPLKTTEKVLHQKTNLLPADGMELSVKPELHEERDEAAESMKEPGEDGGVVEKGVDAWIPGYLESQELPLLEPCTNIRPEDLSGVYNQVRDFQSVQSTFEAPIPTSSVFERDPYKVEFDVRARGSPCSQHSLERLEQDNVQLSDEEGILALSGNIHMSMYNIHAACQNEEEDQDGLELDKLRSESADLINDYRMTDIEDLSTISTSRPLAVDRNSGLKESESSHLELESSYLESRAGNAATDSLVYTAPSESPDIRKYSVKEEIAQLRQSVREELINFRSNEPDEAISTGGSDDEYERIIIMRYEKELESKFSKPREKENKSAPVRRKNSRTKSQGSGKGCLTPPVSSHGDHSIPGSKEPFESSSDEKDWEILDADDVDNERSQKGSNFGSSYHSKQTTPIIRRRRPSDQEDRRVRSASVGKRNSGEFLGYSKDVSPSHSLNNFQTRRRDSFLDVSSSALESPRTAESLESLVFFSKTITDTADMFQKTLNETAQKFSKTLDETAATLKKAMSEKNIAHATTQELTETLHDTAHLLTQTSQVLSQTAQSSADQLNAHGAMTRLGAIAPDCFPEPPARRKRPSSYDEDISFSKVQSKLDTIASQSEVEESERDSPQHPVNQALERVKDTYKTFSPIDPRSQVASPETRPSSAGSDQSFKTPFGRTATSRSARDIFDQMKPSGGPYDPVRPSASRGEVNKRREESRSPERKQKQGSRGRDDRLFNQPLTRTQSAVPIQRNHSIEASLRPESRVRSASVTPGQSTQRQNLGSNTSLNRTPSYRLLGGRLVESFYSRDSRSSEDNLSHKGAATSYTILKEPSFITTKDGKRQSMKEYEKNLIEDYKRRSQQNLTL